MCTARAATSTPIRRPPPSSTAIADADVVVLGVKAYSLPALAPRIGELLRPDAVVVAAQNGIPWWYFQRHDGPLEGRIVESVDPGGVVSRAIRPEQVVGCVVYCSTEIAAPGVIRHIEGTRFSIGDARRRAERRLPEHLRGVHCRRAQVPRRRRPAPADLAEADRQRRLQPDHHHHPRHPRRAGGLAARGRVRSGRSWRSAPRWRARSAIELPVSLDRRLEAGLAVGDHRTSMLQDWEAGKPLETDCMTAAVVEIAGMVDVPVPNVQALHELTKAVEELRDA